MQKLLESLNTLWVEAGIKVVYTILILIIGSRLIKVLIKFLKKDKVFGKIDKSVATFLISFINVTLYILLVIVIAGVIGIPSASIITLLGSAGVAIGLALQGGLSNIAGGILILIFKPFKVGDFIDNHTDCGTVKSITIFYTTLTTPDNRTISIPNGSLANQTLINFSREKERRLDINIDVSYDNSVELVKKTLQKIVDGDERIDKEKDIFIRLTNYKDSSMEYTIRVWTTSNDFWNVKFDLLEKIKDAFDKNNISIPYNQLDVHVENKK